jgi:hypothetical protein
VRCFDSGETSSHTKRPSPEALAVDLVCEHYMQIEKDFLKAYSLRNLISDTPATGHAAVSNNLPFNFKPLPKGLMPVAPNSVFDLSKFMQLATA